MAGFKPARQSQAPSAGQQNQDVPPTIPASQHAPPAAANPPLPPAAVPSSGKRRRGRPLGSKNKPKPPAPLEAMGGRGRPLGSKNKPKPPVRIAEENSTTRHIQLVIPAGCELIATLENFARQQQIGIHAVSGFGTVGNVKLGRPPRSFPGSFRLLALAGTYKDPSMYTGSFEGTSPFILDGIAPWLTMFVSGSDRHIINRSVAVSEALTITDVVVNIMTFKTRLEIQRVDPSVVVFQKENSSSGRMSVLIWGNDGTSGAESGGSAEMAGELPAPAGFVPSSGDSFRPPKSEPLTIVDDN